MKTISTVTILILGLVLPQPKEALVLPFNSRIPKPVLSTLKPRPDQIDGILEKPQNKAGMKYVRYLQILAGMERLEYVVVYWVLITNIEAILKKKVPKIATDSFKKLWKNKILKILVKKSIGPWLGFEPTVPSSVGQFWSIALTTTPQRRSYRVRSQKYNLSSLAKSLTALWPFVVIPISKCFTFL